MIARLEGVLAEKLPDAVLVDVKGVGYEVRVPFSTFFRLPDPGKTIRLRIHTHVREDQFQLYGFFEDVERAAFRQLLTISGVGTRLALAVLSALSVDDFAGAVRGRDVAVLKSVPGVGAKTAERICVELRDKVDRLGAHGGSPQPVNGQTEREAAAISALVNLGYPANHAERAVRRASEHLEEDAPLEDWIKEALSVAAR